MLVFYLEDAYTLGEYCYFFISRIKWGKTRRYNWNSPILFNVYMDQLSEKLNASNIGGNIGGKLVNHLCYADDICLISLSSVGMQQLLSICDIYAKEHDLLYNGGKSSSLCFKPKCSTFNRPTFTLNHLNIPNVNQSKYLGIVINETKL